jgi:hypothetical protein
MNPQTQKLTLAQQYKVNINMAKRPNKPKIKERTAVYGGLKDGTKFIMPWVSSKQARLYVKVNSALAKSVGDSGDYKSMLANEEVILL